MLVVGSGFSDVPVLNTDNKVGYRSFVNLFSYAQTGGFVLKWAFGLLGAFGGMGLTQQDTASVAYVMYWSIRTVSMQIRIGVSGIPCEGRSASTCFRRRRNSLGGLM